VTDVVIIGSGAGGGPLALTLAEAGLEVLVLEKGPEYTREDYTQDEIAINRRDFFIPALGNEMHTLQMAGQDAVMPTFLGWIACCVGGGTVPMAGYFFRFHPDDFRLRTLYGEYEEIADWPYSYDELEPYYSRVEWEIGVSGESGSNPFEGSRSRPYPLPPLDAHPLASCFDCAARRLGLHPFPTPRSITSHPYRGRPGCRYCALCAGYGCGVGAKGSSQEALLPRAVSTGRCEIRPRSMVREITVDDTGRATGCLYLDAEGHEHRVHARVVCVCCSAVESARLLLMSTSPRFPDGLANGSGQVGRHLQFHGFSSGLARFGYDAHPDLPLGESHPFLGRSVMDHYFLPEGVSDLPKGGLLRFGMPSSGPIASALRAAEDNGVPEQGGLVWGAELEKRLRERFHDYQTVEFEVFHDFIPNAGTRVELDPRNKDRWGLPVALIHLDIPEHHRKAGGWLVERGLDILREMGADQVRAEEIGETAGILVHGTCRAGTDPTASVVDAYCQAHEVPNLFVVDGSFMPTSGGAPPTLTIMANSFRTADHIVTRARQGEFGGAS
jgi:choline dehydrogenase-like flavoprotein